MPTKLMHSSPPPPTTFDYFACQVSRIQVPVAVVELEVEKERTSTSQPLASTEKIQFEVNKGSLETMLEGFRKIKDQLSTMG
jgi:hypothetical protein